MKTSEILYIWTCDKCHKRHTSTKDKDPADWLVGVDFYGNEGHLCTECKDSPPDWWSFDKDYLNGVMISAFRTF